jgi:hypothetical protein
MPLLGRTPTQDGTERPGASPAATAGSGTHGSPSEGEGVASPAPDELDRVGHRCSCLPTLASAIIAARLAVWVNEFTGRSRNGIEL